MKDEARSAAPNHPAERIAAAVTAPDIYVYDDVYVAPTHGFDGADDYYARNSSGDYLTKIAVPTLLLHAENDPWIPAKDYLRRQWAWPLHMAMATDGGHVGFHSQDNKIPWHDRCAEVFFRSREDA